MPLDYREQKKLLSVARSSIENHLNGTPLPLLEIRAPALTKTRGAFVSLHKGEELRGCIGTFTSNKPLFLLVRDMAISAATEDLRFTPVTKEELPQITIEISALTPLEKIDDTDVIKVGTHGIYIVSGRRRGVLLPQVAVEYGFDRNTFLDQTCIKAGLAPGSWRVMPVDIYIFKAEIFREEKIT